MLVLSCGALACRQPAPAMLTHDAYIWQRQWTPALEQATLRSASRITTWRVLAAEIDRSGRVVESSPHLDVLARTGNPVIAVVRISGQVDDWDQASVARQGLGLVQRWREAGVQVVGLEIDHDCPTAGLRRYASFLSRLRQARPADVPLALSITALPAWLESERLGELLQQVDHTVLQVHAVQHPREGLFDAAQAQAWAVAWSKVSTVPFRIALPTYGSRVAWTPDGRITAIQSEAPTLTLGVGDPADRRELFATPRDIAAFISTLRRDPPAHLVGFAWFRLPTDADERAWSLATWHAVMDGSPLTSDIRASVERQDTIPGLYNVMVTNSGEVEDAFPASVTVTTAAGRCEAADAMAPYVMERQGEAIAFQRIAPRLLARHRQILIGWVRCPASEVRVHAHS
jgi:hypothetical protein